MLVATVLHDPELAVYRRYLDWANSKPFNSKDFMVLASQQTPASSYRLMLGNRYITQSKAGLADARREALRYFLDTNHSHILLADFDRLLYWLAHDKSSLYNIMDDLYDNFVIIGRTEQAMLTHPEPQRSTERAIIAYTYAALGICGVAQDFVAGTYIMSRDMAHYIASYSCAVDPGAIDVEWLALAQTFDPKQVKFIQVDGLGYEGVYTGSEPGITDDVKRKRQLNLERAVAYADTVKFWGGL